MGACQRLHFRQYKTQVFGMHAVSLPVLTKPLLLGSFRVAACKVAASMASHSGLKRVISTPTPLFTAALSMALGVQNSCVKGIR